MRKFRERLAKTLDLPKEVALDLSRIIITAENEIYVENYKNVIEYTDTLTRLKTSGRALEIRGRGLSIRAINDDDIHITGQIDSVTFTNS